MNRFLKIIYVVAIVTALVLSFALLFPAYVHQRKMRAKVDMLEKLLDRKKAECLEKNQLLNDIRGQNPKTIEKIVREKYGMCKPGEVIYTYDPNTFKVRLLDSGDEK
jgi:cell division protein FtsB